MRLSLSLIAIAIVLGSSAFGRDNVVSETIRLQYLEPNNVAETLKDRQGIDRLTLNFTDNSVTFRGTEIAVAKFKADISRMDIPRPQCEIKMHLVRVHMDAAGKKTETIVMTPSILTFPDVPATLSQFQNKSGFTILLTFSRNADKTFSVDTEIRELGDDGEIVSSGKNVRTLKQSETVRTVGMTEAKDKTLRSAVHRGEIVNSLGEYTGYYLDVKVEERSGAGK